MKRTLILVCDNDNDTIFHAALTNADGTVNAVATAALDGKVSLDKIP
jgi:hypothetical protein